MKKGLILFIFSCILSVVIIAQDEPAFGIRFSGFVKTDIFWDSRQTVAAREGHFLLYPANEKLDAEGNDINAKANFNMLSIQTRLRGTITGPDALGAKTSGVIEGAFFGHSDGDINGFRLRHAFVKLQWTKTSLLVGQFWHPMFVTACFPGVVSFNTGTPFQPFSRNPQIRVTQNLGKFNFILTALSELDFVSTGPDGASEKYIRNSAIPTFNFRIEYHNINKEENKEFLVGAGINYKTLLPRLSTDSNYKTSETIGSLSEMIYLKLRFPKITFKLEGVYAEDPYDRLMIGGYGVESYTDPMKDYVVYAPVSTASGWLDIHTNGKTWQVGLLAGYSKNMGAGEDLVGPTYQRGANIAYLYRIAPRFIYNSGRFRIAPEIEYTVAAYGETIKADGTVEDIKEIGNVRFLLGVYLFF
ncbi:MAG: hypothetical protein V2I47_04780 [Bacteroidales bacterium]|jgi:hypothetical protein|nr:hypothetical protein [Bacteroidales bacterium]